MADTLTKEQRSHCMSQVKGKDTAPEVRLRKALFAEGLRYRLHYKLSGKPDIVFVSARVAVFVDGCFWHGCPEHGEIPQNNREFWQKKIEGTVARDRRVTEELNLDDWLTLRFWTHELKEDLDGVVDKIKMTVESRKGGAGDAA